MGGRKILPFDPRPSRADAEHRRLRKEMEKEHQYEWVPPIVLGLLGITLAWDVTKDVAKCEERKKKEEEEKEKEEDERRRRRRQKHIRRQRRYDDLPEEDEEDEDSYQERRTAGGRLMRTDSGLERAGRLERGEGGSSWDRGRDRGDDSRKRWSIGYDDDPYDYANSRSRRGRDDADYDYEYDTRGRTYDDRKSRPRPRRRSSDW